MTIVTKDLAATFLASGDTSILKPREEKIARLIAEGKSYQDIADIFQVTTQHGRQLYERVRRIILRQAQEKAAIAEIDSLIANLKAAHKPLDQISVEGLVPIRTEIALRAGRVETLGDAVKRGKRGLLRITNFGETGLKAVEAILLRFDVSLPE
jgi:hypothetical protein